MHAMHGQNPIVGPTSDEGVGSIGALPERKAEILSNSISSPRLSDPNGLDHCAKVAAKNLFR